MGLASKELAIEDTLSSTLKLPLFFQLKKVGVCNSEIVKRFKNFRRVQSVISLSLFVIFVKDNYFFVKELSIILHWNVSK